MVVGYAVGLPIGIAEGTVVAFTVGTMVGLARGLFVGDGAVQTQEPSAAVVPAGHAAHVDAEVAPVPGE